MFIHKFTSINHKMYAGKERNIYSYVCMHNIMLIQCINFCTMKHWEAFILGSHNSLRRKCLGWLVIILPYKHYNLFYDFKLLMDAKHIRR